MGEVKKRPCGYNANVLAEIRIREKRRKKHEIRLF